MKSTRTLDDIFHHLQELAKSKDQNSQNEETKLLCKCGKFIHSEEDKEEENYEEDCQDTDVIYIDLNSLGHKYFAVCPACHPRSHCLLCGGTGHMVFANSHVVETQSGALEFQTEDLTPHACSCLYLEHLADALNKAQIPDRYIQADLNSFDLNHLQNEKQKEKLNTNIEKMANLMSYLGENHRNKNKGDMKFFVTLFGPVGSGKTLLATAGMKMLMMNYGLSGKFIDFQNLLSQLRAEYDEQKTGENILKELRLVDVLIIDEFGKGRNDKEWQLEKLDDLVNARYNAQKITILTTNYLPPNFKYLDKEMPMQRNKDIYSPEIPLNESFWQQNLLERIGMRMFERIIEVSEFIDFTQLPSYRRYMGRSFLELYQSKQKGS